MTEQDQAPGGIDASTPNVARVYDYMLGGKDNFPADREVAEALLANWPESRNGALENRAFLRRAVRYLAAEAGIRQFLDIGTGIPTQGNVHEVAGEVAPDARVVYVDNDPVVHAHSNALLACDRTISILADLREPEVILDHPEVRRLLDFGRPMALLLVAVLHFIRDEEDPAGIIARLRDAIAPGGYLVISHGGTDFDPEGAEEAGRIYQRAAAPMVTRTRAQIERFFDGFELVEPGLVDLPRWRPDGQGPGQFGMLYGAIGRKRG